MWLSLTALIISIIVVVLLTVRWQVICSWDGGLVEVRLRFLGLSRTIWKVDVFEHISADPVNRSEGINFEKLGTIPGVLVDHAQAVLEHRDILVRAGRVGAQLARRFRHWWRLDRGTIELSVGMKNPAHTGMTHGTISAVSGMICAFWPQLRVVSIPEFDTPSFGSRGEIVFSFRAWEPLKDLIRFGATLPWRGMLKLKRRFAY